MVLPALVGAEYTKLPPPTIQLHLVIPPYDIKQGPVLLKDLQLRPKSAVDFKIIPNE
jgi:hypothetical protein